MAKLYVASSWRNPYQPYIVQLARKNGLEVYDFRNPIEGDHGFSWTQIVDRDPEYWTFDEYREILKHPIAEKGFQLDMKGLQADATLLVMPAGRSAHLELGYAVGKGQRTAVLYPVGVPLSDIGGHKVTENESCGKCHGNIVLEDKQPFHQYSSVLKWPCKLKTKAYDDFEPELMVKCASDGILIGITELQDWLGTL